MNKVTPEWIAKKYKEFFAELPKHVDIKIRERLAFRATENAIREFKHTNDLMDYFRETSLKNLTKYLNYTGPIFQKRKSLEE